MTALQTGHLSPCSRSSASRRPGSAGRHMGLCWNQSWCCRCHALSPPSSLLSGAVPARQARAGLGADAVLLHPVPLELLQSVCSPTFRVLKTAEMMASSLSFPPEFQSVFGNPCSGQFFGQRGAIGEIARPILSSRS